MTEKKDGVVLRLDVLKRDLDGVIARLESVRSCACECPYPDMDPENRRYGITRRRDPSTGKYTIKVSDAGPREKI